MVLVLYFHGKLKLLIGVLALELHLVPQTDISPLCLTQMRPQLNKEKTGPRVNTITLSGFTILGLISKVALFIEGILILQISVIL